MASATTPTTRLLRSVEDLFRFVFEHEQTIVFTNLGRKPSVVFQILNRDYGNVDVAVVSPYYAFPSRGRIHPCRLDEVADARCDLLLFVEPTPHVAVARPPHASRLVVLTSHMVFPRPKDALLASYFYVPKGRTVDQLIEDTRSLVATRDPSVQAHDAHHVSVDHADARWFVADRRDDDEAENAGYAIVDLTQHTSKVRTYLAFWDVFDTLLELRNRQRHEKSENEETTVLRGWLTCFNDKSKSYKAFVQFTQNVLDGLYCVGDFEHGNVLEQNRLLALLPFFQSGIVDPPLKLKTESFGGCKYVVPKTEQELYRAGSRLNLRHMVGAVYRVLNDNGGNDRDEGDS